MIEINEYDEKLLKTFKEWYKYNIWGNVDFLNDEQRSRVLQCFFSAFSKGYMPSKSAVEEYIKNGSKGFCGRLNCTIEVEHVH